jgi:cell division protein FtsA
MYLVTIGSSPAMNLRKSVERAGYRVKELVLEPLASALAVLTEDEKELGVVLVEMGAGTTDVALFHEGKIRHLATIAFGGNAVTNDIVQGIGVTQSDAERLKERFGSAYEPMVDPEEIIELPGTAAQGERHVSREVLSHIIHQRIDEIFSLVQSEIERVGYVSRLSGGVVVTGGAAAMEGISALATDVFGTGVRIGTPVEHVGGLSDSVDAPRFSTVVGLALYGANRVALAGASAAGRKRALSSPGMDRFANAVKTWLQDFF